MNNAGRIDRLRNRVSDSTAGTVYTITAFLMWGVLPGYWKQLKSIPSDEIVFHRIIWTCIVSMFFVFFTGKRGIFHEIVKNGRLRLVVVFSSMAIFVNWLTYIYAVNSGNIVQASLGYYINPLVSIFLGMVVLREKLSRMQIAALIFAATGVLYMAAAADFGSLPWIALTLGFSFGIYGLVKKMGNLDSISSLGLETMFLVPLSLVFLAVKTTEGTGSFGRLSPGTDLLLMASGIISAAPLFCFAQGAKKIPLSRVGFIQYITPTAMLLIGVLVYGEAFTGVHAVSFGLIWTALIIYTLSGIIEK